MNLYISTYLASYRLDLCERLSRDHGFAIYHYMGDEVPADVKPFWEEYTFENNRLPVKTLFGKYYAVGLKDLLARLKPSVVFIQEFSLITIQLLLLRRLLFLRRLSAAAEQQRQNQQPRQRFSHVLSLSRRECAESSFMYTDGEKRKTVSIAQKARGLSPRAFFVSLDISPA